MPKKPTEPYGWIKFSKDGKVEKDIRILSQDKQLQEEEVTKLFIKSFNRQSGDRKIINYKKLPEHSQDFLLSTKSNEIYLQVTEIVEREFTSPMTQEEYDYGDWKNAYLKKSGEIPWKLDKKKMEKALFHTINKKIDQRYFKVEGKELWLLVFTTFTLYETKYVYQKEYYDSNALILARNKLSKIHDLVFDEIWFTNLLTNAVQVWPTLINGTT